MAVETDLPREISETVDLARLGEEFVGISPAECVLNLVQFLIFLSYPDFSESTLLESTGPPVMQARGGADWLLFGRICRKDAPTCMSLPTGTGPLAIDHGDE